MRRFVLKWKGYELLKGEKVMLVKGPAAVMALCIENWDCIASLEGRV